MMFNFGKVFNHYNDKLGNFFYKNNNVFTYNFFSKRLTKKLIEKNDNNDFEINNFLKDGIINGPKISDNDCNKILNTLDAKNGSYNKNNTQFFFSINCEIKNHIKKIIPFYFGNLFDNFSKLFNSNIFLCHCVISKISHYNKNNLKEESFADNFHNDRWFSNHFKIFILLDKVNLSQGPTVFIKKTDTKKFSEKMRYKSRANYDFKNIHGDEIYNCGLKGETRIVDTTQVIHRASIPEKNNTRTMMVLSFAIYPEFNKNIFYFDNSHLGSDWDVQNYNIVNFLAKPIGVRKLFKLYKNILNSD